MNALHEQFIVEARELIHQATEDLIATEREGFSTDRVDRVFLAPFILLKVPPASSICPR